MIAKVASKKVGLSTECLNETSDCEELRPGKCSSGQTSDRERISVALERRCGQDTLARCQDDVSECDQETEEDCSLVSSITASSVPAGCIVVLDWLCSDDSFLIQLESEEKLNVFCRFSEQLGVSSPDVMLSPRSGVFVFGLAAPQFRHPSVEDSYSGSEAGLSHLWLVTVSSHQLHLQCCQLAYWAARTKRPCQVTALLCAAPRLLPRLLGELARSQTELQDCLTELQTGHETLLLRLFPCTVNSFSAQYILHRVGLLSFLSLSRDSLLDLLPWLSAVAVDSLSQVTDRYFHLAQFLVHSPQQ